MIQLLAKVIEYYEAKDDPLAAPNIYSDQEEDSKSTVKPLFPTINEPSENLVGHLIDLKCGHTQRPSDLETVMFTVHLEVAGFYKTNKASS